MKKIAMGIAALALAANVFAVDFAASVVMEGNVANGTVDLNEDGKDTNAVNFWNLGAKDQKDADALIISTSGDKAGAQFQLWYNYTGKDADLKVRSTNLWFKPVDMVKVTVGDFDMGTYKETINWWKVAVGNTAAEHDSWGGAGRWSSTASVAGAGVNVDVTPIDGLSLSCGVAAGTGNNALGLTMKHEEDKNPKVDVAYAAYGATAQYNFSGLIDLPITGAISWRDSGKDSYKILSIGGDYGNNWADGFYGFLNTRLYFSKVSYTGTAIPRVYSWSTKTILTGIALDNYYKFQAGAFKIQARTPVTIRTVKSLKNDAGLDAYDYGMAKDPSYMSYQFRAQYGLDGFTPYLSIENDNAVTFDDNFVKTLLKMDVRPGVQLNVGSCSLDVALSVMVPNDKNVDLTWSVPFLARVSY